MAAAAGEASPAIGVVDGGCVGAGDGAPGEQAMSSVSRSATTKPKAILQNHARMFIFTGNARLPDAISIVAFQGRSALSTPVGAQAPQGRAPPCPQAIPGAIVIHQSAPRAARRRVDYALWRTDARG